MSTQTEPKLVTQIDFARAGQITPQMKEVAEREHRDPEYIRERVADGRIAIPANIVHIKKGMRAFGVGEGLSTKVNVNLGISGDKAEMCIRDRFMAVRSPKPRSCGFLALSSGI